MTDYFSEYSTFIGSKGLPSPADTPYETPSHIRSKRSSRTTPGASREESASPPPLPPDSVEVEERSQNGRYTALDPRRFTPTLHASLVSEILSLRREVDSKNSLVENLETTLSAAQTNNETLTEQVSQHGKEMRKAKQQLQLMERGTYDALEDLAKERDVARSNAEDLRAKLEAAQKTGRLQDEDAERTQQIWEAEKEAWEGERRQLERRVHVTETRLRAVVQEINTRQASVETKQLAEEVEYFKDSGLGNESDAGSMRSAASPVKHRRNRSSVSSRTRSIRNSVPVRALGTPDPHGKPTGYSLADELGIDEEDEYDIDEFEHGDDELDMEYTERLRKTMESRQSSSAGDIDSKAKRVLGLTSESTESPVPSPTQKEFRKRSIDSVKFLESAKRAMDQPAVSLPTVAEAKPYPRVIYVDTGYQPSPPPSPPRDMPVIPTIEEPEAPAEERFSIDSQRHSQAFEAATRLAASPISPPDTPTVDGGSWSPDEKRIPAALPEYSDSSTQTEFVDTERHKGHTAKRDSLSPPSHIPSIAIHPSSRPSSPRTYVLPPGTKNASTQASLPAPSRDAGVQTEEIRVDKRPVKLPAHLLPGYLLPSPTFQELAPPTQAKRATSSKTKPFKKTVKIPVVPESPPLRSPDEDSAGLSRTNSQKDLRNMPLKAIPLPKPVLSPLMGQDPTMSEGPLNRSSQYGVTKSGQMSSTLLAIDKDSEISDNDEPLSDVDHKDLANSIPAQSRPPHGRFGLSEPPKAVPEDKEISPERRPDTAGSYGAAPAPSISSSRANSRSTRNNKAPARLNSHKDLRSRSPSFGSMASSSYSTQSAAINPPFPIPTRSSSRVVPNSHSEGSQSPTPFLNDVFGSRQRLNKAQQTKQNSLRKVQSAAVMRNSSSRKGSPKRSRKYSRRSPDLTPVQSMAFDSDSPEPTKFPIPELPTELQDGVTFDYIKGSVDLGKDPDTGISSVPRVSEETNLVDAIASTMVGEWMWKYIRKRKSFGVQEDFPVAEDGSVNTSTHGSRHKRWVWLSPYERTIMWDTKQPTTGNALLGKKGRKLAIQSVLDVQDDTALPKNPELKTAHKRSILILTPARALKFTTISPDRHALWMTALSFLAQSGRLPSQIPPMPPNPPSTNSRPPIPAFEPPPIKRGRSPSFGRSTVRDSIRLAKNKRPELPKGVTEIPPLPGQHSIPSFETSGGVDESADFPSVPRLYISTTKHQHQRKRSNTSPRLPTSLQGFRSFSSSAVSSSSALQPSTNGSSFRPSYYHTSASSKSGSRQESRQDSMERPNFFEAVGTVRMEAFVDPNVRDGVLYVPRPPSGVAGTAYGSAGMGMGDMGLGAMLPGTRMRRRRGDSNVSQASIDKKRGGYVFDEFGRDPFKGF